jgi:hypothetical protein
VLAALTVLPEKRHKSLLVVFSGLAVNSVLAVLSEKTHYSGLAVIFDLTVLSKIKLYLQLSVLCESLAWFFDFLKCFACFIGYGGRSSLPSSRVYRLFCFGRAYRRRFAIVLLSILNHET